MLDRLSPSKETHKKIFKYSKSKNIDIFST